MNLYQLPLTMKLPVELLQRLRATAGKGCSIEELETVAVRESHEELRQVAVAEMRRRHKTEHDKIVATYETKTQELDEAGAKFITDQLESTKGLGRAIDMVEAEGSRLRATYSKKQEKLQRELHDIQELMKKQRDESERIEQQRKQQCLQREQELEHMYLQKQQECHERELAHHKLMDDTTRNVREEYLQSLKKLDEMIRLPLPQFEPPIGSHDEAAKTLMQVGRPEGDMSLVAYGQGSGIHPTESTNKIDLWLCLKYEKRLHKFSAVIPSSRCVVRGVIRQKGEKRCTLLSVLALMDTLASESISIGTIHVDSAYLDRIFNRSYFYADAGTVERRGIEHLHEDLILRVMQHKYRGVSFVCTASESDEQNYGMASRCMAELPPPQEQRGWCLLSMDYP